VECALSSSTLDYHVLIQITEMSYSARSLARSLNIACPYTPVAQDEEKALFKLLLQQQSGSLNVETFTRLFNDEVNSKQGDNSKLRYKLASQIAAHQTVNGGIETTQKVKARHAVMLEETLQLVEEAKKGMEWKTTAAVLPGRSTLRRSSVPSEEYAGSLQHQGVPRQPQHPTQLISEAPEENRVCRALLDRAPLHAALVDAMIDADHAHLAQAAQPTRPNQNGPQLRKPTKPEILALLKLLAEDENGSPHPASARTCVCCREKAYALWISDREGTAVGVMKNGLFHCKGKQDRPSCPNVRPSSFGVAPLMKVSTTPTSPYASHDSTHELTHVF
jgi:hypothetical protein